MSFLRRKNLLSFFGLLFVLLQECRAVRINSISVPKVFEIKKDAEPLILKCDYTIEETETGMVLKWKHNGVQVYQWIPSSKAPFGLGSFQKRVDTNYTTSEDKYKKHSALKIMNPNVNDTGTYSCHVHTFQGHSEESANLQIIDKEDSIDLTYNINPNDTVDIKCEITQIYPLPDVKIMLDDVSLSSELVSSSTRTDDTFDYSVSTQVKRDDLKDESTIACIMSIKDADYTQKREVTFDDPKQSATTKTPILGELTKHSEADATNVNNAPGLTCSLSFFVLTLLLTLLQ